MLRESGMLVLVAVALQGASAWAGDVYRCELNGVTAFVDSPDRCPDGSSRRLGGSDESRTRKSSPQGPRLDEPRTGTVASSRHPPTAASPLAPSPLARPLAASPCQKLAQEPVRARECLREERRAEVRRIASARLAQISRAVSNYVSVVSSAGSIIATPTSGRPAAWCEDILRDLMAHKDIEVVDDETTGGPEWMYSGNGPARSAAEILDPNYKEWRLADDKVPEGYVTARWRGSNLVVLRVAAACTEGSDGVAHCNAHRLVNVYVYDNATPMACAVSEVGRAYWPGVKSSQTQIFAQLPGR